MLPDAEGRAREASEATYVGRIPWLRLPPRYVRASIIASWGGLLFGLDTGTIGPVSAMASFQQYVSSSSSLVHGLIISSILIPAAISSFFAGNLADRIGRPRAIMIGAFIFGIGTAVEASTIHIAMFFVGRATTGIGEGLFLSTVIVYICELAPPNQRGPLTCTVQFLTTIGVFLGYFIAYGTVQIDSSVSWRLPLALQSFLSFSFSAACIFLPQSPRWLAQNGRHEDAARAWKELGINRTEDDIGLQDDEKADAEKAQPGADMALRNIRPPKHAYLRVFKKDVRKQTALGVFLLAMMQLSGIDGVLYYAPLLFKQAGLETESASFLASGVSAVVIVVVTIPGFLLSDHWGRRTSAITGGIGLAASMILIGSLYASNTVHANTGAGRWVVIVTIYVFAAVFSVTWAVALKVYPSEIQPPVTRAAATSLGQSANWITNFVVALCTPIILSQSSSAVYFIFGGSSLLTLAVCIAFMPETRGRSLEDIQRDLGKPTTLAETSRVGKHQ